MSKDKAKKTSAKKAGIKKADKKKARLSRGAYIGTAAAVAGVPYETPIAVPADKRLVAGSYDMHCHSVFSDGAFTVDELIAQAREAGLAGLAITDHDSLSHLAFVRDRAHDLDFPVLAGIEVSCYNPKTGKGVHILGYGLEATFDCSSTLEQIVLNTQYQRTANTLWQACQLKAAGVEFGGKHLSLDEVCDVARLSTSVYKTHLMEALTGRPKTDPDYQVCWKHYFGRDGIAHRSINYPEVKQVIRAIRELGGVPVLAHPDQKDSWSAIPDMVKWGLMGIEAYHPDHDEAAVARAFEAAAEYGLFVTGGSDFHGKYSKAPALGCAYVMPEEAGARVQKLFEIERELG